MTTPNYLCFLKTKQKNKGGFQWSSHKNFKPTMKQQRTCDAVLNDNYGDSIVLCQNKVSVLLLFSKSHCWQDQMANIDAYSKW